MKKETIFRHELNESIQADAAMNCLKNRNKPQQLNEFHPAGLARIALPLLKPVIRKIVTNLVSKIGAKAITGSRLMHTVMNKLNAGTIAKVAQKIGETWTEVPEELKQEIWAFAVHTFKELLEKENAQPQSATQEQEESADEKATFALKLVKKFKNKMTPDYAKNPELFMMLKLQKALKKPLMSLSKEEYRAWAKAICDACDSVFGSAQEQEEDYGMNDLRKWRDSLDFSNNDDDDSEEETYTAYDDTDGIWTIINIMRKKGMLRAQGIEGRDDVDDGHAIDKAYDLIEQKLDDEGMWIGDDDHEAERFVSFFGEEIAEEAMKSAIHNQEQEELPQMERHDMILALAEYMSESWIDTGDDGDLDDIYYAVADILDKTGDYPQSTDWEDCKPWCQKHYKEVEARIY